MDGFDTPGVAIIRTLPVRGLLIPWREYDTVSSTMDAAVEAVRAGRSDWMAVSALVQTSGRGTRGREWRSFREKGLWVSVIMPPPKRIERIEGLTVAAAESLVESLRELTGTRFEIKHPNDVVSRGRKLAGILVESVTTDAAVRSLILGMGVNISQNKADFQAAGLPEATSLFQETGFVPDRHLILESFLRHFIPAYDALAAGEGNDSTPSRG